MEGIGIVLGVLVFMLLIFLGLPIFFCFFAGTLVVVFLLDLPLAFAPSVAFFAANSPVLVAVALFLFAGHLMSHGGIADSMMRLAYLLVGKLRGGLAAVCVVTALMLAALTGSGLASIAATGAVMIPRMEKYGYDRRYSTAVICASGFLGYLIPPSIPVLLYCFIAQQSIAALFMATVIPGIMLAIGYLIVIYFTCGRWMQPVPQAEEEAGKGVTGYLKELGQTTFVAFPALLTPLIVLGGIYGGIFTPTEAAAVAAFYIILIGVFVYRKLKLRSLWRAVSETLGASGMLFILVAFALIFTRTLVKQGAGHAIAAFATGLTDNPYVLLLMIMVLLLILGMFIENISIMLVVTPLLMPLLQSMGFNLIHMGSMIVLAMGIALTTPPFADALFLGARIGGIPFHTLIKPLLPFIFLAAIPVLLIVAYVPQVSLWLPTLVVGKQVVFGIS